MRKQEQSKCADVYPMSILKLAGEYIPGASTNYNHRNSRTRCEPSSREDLLCTGAITSSGQVTGSSLRITGLATVGNSCSPNGQIFIDTTGSLLVCVSGVVTKYGAPKWGTPVDIVTWSEFTVPPSSDGLLQVWGGAMATGTTRCRVFIDGISYIVDNGNNLAVAAATSQVASLPVKAGSVITFGGVGLCSARFIPFI